jgi:hypothetical protein
MSELAVVDTDVEPFDRVEVAPDGRVDYSDGHLTALFPENSETREYVVALFHYGGGDNTVDVPDDTVVLGAGEGVVTALVPAEAYGGGE